jgi:hypothetical protein
MCKTCLRGVRLHGRGSCRLRRVRHHGRRAGRCRGLRVLQYSVPSLVASDSHGTYVQRALIAYASSGNTYTVRGLVCD